MSPPASIPRLLAITNRQELRASWQAWLDAAVAARLPGVILRDRQLSDRERLAALDQAVASGLRVLASGRADLALAAAAAGVHLPADGLPVAAVRALLGPEALIGRSTHDPGEVRRAAAEGVDYVLFGPIWATPGKGPPVGLEALAEACGCGVPVVALGGVEIDRIAPCLDHGAWGVAAIRMLAEPARLAAAVASVAAAVAS